MCMHRCARAHTHTQVLSSLSHLGHMSPKELLHVFSDLLKAIQLPPTTTIIGCSHTFRHGCIGACSRDYDGADSCIDLLTNSVFSSITTYIFFKKTACELATLLFPVQFTTPRTFVRQINSNYSAAHPQTSTPYSFLTNDAL